MNLFQKLGKAALAKIGFTTHTGPEVHGGAENFEALRRTGFRGYVYFPNLKPQQRITRHTRHEMARRAAWLYENTGLGKMLIDKTALHEAGNGIWPKPRTRNTEWNRLVADRFHDTWGEARLFDVEGVLSYYSAQMSIRRQIKLIGDHFGVLAREEGGMARMKFYAGNQIENATNPRLKDQSQWRDGFRLSPQGRIMQVRVLDPEDAGKFTDIPGEYVQHYHDHLWTGQRRGMSMLHHAASKMLTIDDILFYEQQGVKLTSQIGYVLTVPDEGSTGPSINLPGAERSEVSEGADGTKLTIQKIFEQGSVIPQLPPGFKLETFKSDRPGSSFTGFLDYLVRDVTLGSPYSAEFLYFIANIGGAVVRFVLDEAQARIDEVQDNQLIAQFCRPAYKYWLWHEMQRGAVEYPGDDWYRHDMMRPRKVTVDKGREGKLDDDRFASGKIGPRQYYAPMGVDEEDVEEDAIRSVARKKRRIAEIAAEEGVELTYDEVFSANKSAPPQPPEPEEEEEPPKKKPTK